MTKISPKARSFLKEVRSLVDWHHADATALDLWVFDHLEQLFQNATHDVKLNAELRQDKVVIFLHLLGLDTTGHSYRPHSKVDTSARLHSCFHSRLSISRNTCTTSKWSMTSFGVLKSSSTNFTKIRIPVSSLQQTMGCQKLEITVMGVSSYCLCSLDSFVHIHI